MQNKKLWIILISLLAIYGASKVFNKPETKSFKEVLVDIDTSTVTKIIMPDSENPSELLVLERDADSWKATLAGKTVSASAGSVNSLLGQAAYIKAQRLIARSSDKWSQYEVGEDKGSKIELYAGPKLLTSFISGRFAFNQQNRSATSYIRLEGEDDVYSVDGFASMSFRQSFANFRNKTIATFIPEDITEIELSGARLIKLTKSENTWIDQNGIQKDSSDMVQYLNGISNVSGLSFVDDFDIDASPQEILTIKANNQLRPFIVKAYYLSDSTIVLNSSINEESYFESDLTGPYERLFSKMISL